MGAGLAVVGMLSASSAPLTSWFLAPRLPAQIAFGGGLLHGTQSGQIFQSMDEGQTWQPLVSFGANCAVCNLLSLNEQVYVQLAVSSYTFWLCSPDAKTWRTLS
jgi:hypothetical protein